MASKKRGEHTLADILRIRPKWFLEKFDSDITNTLNYIHQLTEFGFADILSQLYLDIFHTWTGIQCEKRDINRMMMERREAIELEKQKRVKNMVSPYEFMRHLSKSKVTEILKSNPNLLKKSLEDKRADVSSLMDKKSRMFIKASEIYNDITKIELEAQHLKLEIDEIARAIDSNKTVMDEDTKFFLKNVHKEYTVAFIDSNKVAYLIRKHRVELKYVGNVNTGMTRTMTSGYPVVVYSIPSNMILYAWMITGTPKSRVEGETCTHPHLSGSSICWGNTLPQIERLSGKRDGYKALGIFDALMTTYCPDNPYVSFNDLCKDVDERGYSSDIKLDYVDIVDRDKAKTALMKTLAAIVINEREAYPDSDNIIKKLYETGMKDVVDFVRNSNTAYIIALMYNVEDAIVNKMGGSGDHIIQYGLVEFMKEADLYDEIVSVTPERFALLDINTEELSLSKLERFIDVWREVMYEHTSEIHYIFTPIILRINKRDTLIAKYTDTLEGIGGSTHLPLSVLGNFLTDFVPPMHRRDEQRFLSVGAYTNIDIENFSKGYTEEDAIVRQAIGLQRVRELLNFLPVGSDNHNAVSRILEPYTRDISQNIMIAYTARLRETFTGTVNNLITIKLTRTEHGAYIERIDHYDTYSSNRNFRTSIRVTHRENGILPRIDGNRSMYSERIYNIMFMRPDSARALYIAWKAYSVEGRGDLGTGEGYIRSDICSKASAVEVELKNRMGENNENALFVKFLESTTGQILDEVTSNVEMREYIESLEKKLQNIELAKNQANASEVDADEMEKIDDIHDDYQDDDDEYDQEYGDEYYEED